MPAECGRPLPGRYRSAVSRRLRAAAAASRRVRRAPAPDTPTGRYHGWLVFPGHHLPHGRGHTVTVPPHLLRHPCADRIHSLAPGIPPAAHITYQEWLVPLALEASHPDPDVLRDYLRECADTVSVRAEGVA
ncbi:hypothetical protein [Streptomyces sp. NPDC051183]|uniref:hypothetical protein n=1 Tax=Streptomyces sp. NPDC051183 TaxID=3155165 RepID=UPI003436268B